MNFDNQISFLVASIFISVGLVIITTTLVFINNILSKYWKPVKILITESWVPKLAFADSIPGDAVPVPVTETKTRKIRRSKTA